VPAIVAEQLTRRFADLVAVNDLSFSVEEGQIFGIVGPDGAGKTTTMRLLTGIMEPSAGNAWVAGHHVTDEPEAIREDIAYMSQRFGLYPDLTVLENILFYADIYAVPRKERQARIDELLGFSNLKPFRNRPAGQLSGGMKQKLGLACALIHTPKVLFLDEPTNGVDPVSRRDFWRILYRLLREKVTIFVSTAYLDEAERCERVALMHRGSLLAAGTPREIKRLMDGELVEIQAVNPRETAALLRKRLASGRIGLFGDRIHVVTPDATRTIGEADNLMEQAGLAVRGLRAIEPSLEDVFISVLTGDDDCAVA